MFIIIINTVTKYLDLLDSLARNLEKKKWN